MTLIEDLADGHKVRTGVTAILPRGRDSLDTWVFGGWFALNGNGEMTGTAWIDESGQLEGPVMLTNTHSVGVVRDAVIAERIKAGGADASGYWWSLPVVAETWDGHLNDINGFHVKPEHVAQALRDAKGGAGRRRQRRRRHRHGLPRVQVRHRHRVAPRQRGRTRLTRSARWCRPTTACATRCASPACRSASSCATTASTPIRPSPPATAGGDTGSIIIVIATDAPLLPHQLKRIAKRAGMGLARMGSYAGNGSGDIFVAFSTANAAASPARR